MAGSRLCPCGLASCGTRLTRSASVTQASRPPRSCTTSSRLAAARTRTRSSLLSCVLRCLLSPSCSLNLMSPLPHSTASRTRASSPTPSLRTSERASTPPLSLSLLRIRLDTRPKTLQASLSARYIDLFAVSPRTRSSPSRNPLAPDIKTPFSPHADLELENKRCSAPTTLPAERVPRSCTGTEAVCRSSVRRARSFTCCWRYVRSSLRETAPLWTSCASWQLSLRASAPGQVVCSWNREQRIGRPPTHRVKEESI